MSFAWVAAGTAVAGFGYSVYSGEQSRKAAGKAASKQRKQQSALAAEESSRYYSELQRQAGYESRAYAGAQADYSRMQKARSEKYTAEMKDYEEITANLEAWKENWAGIAEDPRSHAPGWPSFETAVTEAATSEMEKIEDLYQRRGKAESGEYMRAVSEIESSRQESLQDALMGLTREARGKMFEIEAAMPKRPTMMLPQMATPVLGGAQSSFGMGQLGIGQGYVPEPQSAIGDIKGLGKTLAWAADKFKAKDDPKAPVTSTLAGVEGGVTGSQEWAIPGAAEQYEGLFGEDLIPQQTQYSLLG